MTGYRDWLVIASAAQEGIGVTIRGAVNSRCYREHYQNDYPGNLPLGDHSPSSISFTMSPISQSVSMSLAARHAAC